MKIYLGGGPKAFKNDGMKFVIVVVIDTVVVVIVSSYILVTTIIAHDCHFEHISCVPRYMCVCS